MFKWNATSTTPAYAALGPAQLNYMVKLAEQLTYRQFVIVSIAGAMTKRGIPTSTNLESSTTGSPLSTCLARLRLSFPN